MESVEALAADKIMHELIGDKLVTAVIAVRKVREKNHLFSVFLTYFDQLII